MLPILNLMLFSFSGDVGFDDREILRDATNLEESLFKSPDITSPRAPEEIKNIDEGPEKNLDVDMTAPVANELDEPSFMGNYV